MSVSPLLISVVSAAGVAAADGAPEPTDVKAGWTALVIVLLLVVATVLLSVSLVRQLRKAQASQDAGLYDESGRTPPGTATPPSGD